jgi:hypothetical protein
MSLKIENTLQYFRDTLGIDLKINILSKNKIDKLPMYIGDTFRLYETEFYQFNIILAELVDKSEFSIQMLDKQINQIKKILNYRVLLILENVAAYQRKRLIDKGLNFIVPYKQLYLPEFLIDLREIYTHPKALQKSKKLLPSAQLILIYHFLHRNKNWVIEEHSFKEIALKLKYTPMAISNAVENLKIHKLIAVDGEKQKFIRFKYSRQELWNKVVHQELFVNPIAKTVFVNKIPEGLPLLQSNISALSAYTDISPSKQNYFAIEKTEFYEFQKKMHLLDLNEYEGDYAIELWKYNPHILIEELPDHFGTVDPISTYLILKGIEDERIKIALNQILEKYIW